VVAVVCHLAPGERGQWIVDDPLLDLEAVVTGGALVLVDGHSQSVSGSIAACDPGRTQVDSLSPIWACASGATARPVAATAAAPPPAPTSGERLAPVVDAEPSTGRSTQERSDVAIERDEWRVCAPSERYESLSSVNGPPDDALSYRVPF
jgi:hypothetical protein